MILDWTRTLPVLDFSVLHISLAPRPPNREIIRVPLALIFADGYPTGHNFGKLAFQVMFALTVHLGHDNRIGI